MSNSITVKRENGESFKIEIILGFEVEELNKRFIAYTLNDDGVKEKVTVCISEIDTETSTIKDLVPEEMDIVMNAYEEAKNCILNQE